MLNLQNMAIFTTCMLGIVFLFWRDPLALMFPTCMLGIVFLLTITALKMGLFGEVQDQDKNEIDLVEATDSLNAKNRRIAELKEVLKLAREDLLMRAEEDSNGLKVVGISSSIWTQLNEELKK